MYANMDEYHIWYFSEPTKTLDTIDHEILLHKLQVFCNFCYPECSLLNYIKIIVQHLHIPGLHNYQFCLLVHKFLFCNMLPSVFSIQVNNYNTKQKYDLYLEEYYSYWVKNNKI